MVKHTQTIRRQQPTNCLSVFDHFVGLALTGLSDPVLAIYIYDSSLIHVYLLDTDISLFISSSIQPKPPV